MYFGVLAINISPPGLFFKDKCYEILIHGEPTPYRLAQHKTESEVVYGSAKNTDTRKGAFCFIGAG